MSDIKRKLATIESVTDIQPHPNADKLEIATIRGWQVVVQKDLYKVGQQVLFFEVDSFIPDTGNPELEFLRKSSFRSTVNLGDGFRIKTIKLRGEISQGLIAPLSDFFSCGLKLEDGKPSISSLNFVECDVDETCIFRLEEGQDVTELLGIKLWELPIPVGMSGQIKGTFPSHLVPKTDQVRYQNLGRELYGPRVEDTFEVTVKMDGSSMTILWFEKEFRVASRNMELKEDDGNVFWRVAKETGLKDAFESFKLEDFTVAIQGELVGPGIQGNPHKLDKQYFYIFDMYDIEGKFYFTSAERIETINSVNEIFGLNLLHVPVDPILLKGIPNREDMKNSIAILSKQKKEELGYEVEGFVFKSLNDPSFSFKYINPEYDLKDKN